jgi:hypothetical protein
VDAPGGSVAEGKAASDDGRAVHVRSGDRLDRAQQEHQGLGDPMTTRKSRRAVLAAAFCSPVVLAPLAVAAPASAQEPAGRPSPRPPVVTAAPTWRFDIGSQVDRTSSSQKYYSDLRVFHQKVPVKLTWRGHAQGWARISGYDLFQYHVYTGRLVSLLRNTRSTEYTYYHKDIAYPPRIKVMGLHPTFRLVAKDTAGRTTVLDPIRRGPVFSEQENGTTYQNGRSVFPQAPQADRGWKRTSGSSYDAGSALVSSVKGSSVRIPVRAHSGGQWFALEMTTGPRLGSVEVRVDGRRVGHIDTSSRRTRHRVLVAEYFVKAGRHTVTLTNLGLAHRRTVELDGVFASD